MINKILILSVTVGTGHMRAAEALKKAAGCIYPDTEVIILDTFHYASPLLEKLVLGTYLEILKMSPEIYGYLYRQAERGQPLSGRGKFEFNRVLNLVAAPRLVKFIKDFNPEVIVCTHPFPLGIMSSMKKKGIFEGPVFAAITDFTIHSFWVFPEVDYYLVGAEQMRLQCEEFGIDPSKVCITGIPIDPAFTVLYDKKELRERLGLDPDLPVILIMGGGLGMGCLATAVRELGGSAFNCQLMVVAGTNTALKEKLVKIAPGLSCKIKVFGFVDNVHQLMAASDLMVGKAGGLSCAEAMAMGLPILIIDPLPGQEERNTEFMAAVGAGLRLNMRDLAGQVKAYFMEPDRLEMMARAAAALGRPKAAFDTVNIMAEIMTDAREMQAD
ncbi:MAG: Processive diacylglycerol beta-glucosyltransferase [Pelotomaculum sp. PtaU1.Bin035]|nr:MAG: Processive diacylglycerol beta-glucosyltransferase [Pelotomaculum sp. PtaU1.Bin035]